MAKSSAELTRIIVGETTQVVHGGLQPLMSLIAESAVFLFVTLLLVITEPRATIVVVVVLGASAWAIQRALQRLIAAKRDQRVASHTRMFHALGSALGSLKETVVLGRASFFVESFRGAAAAYGDAGKVQTALTTLPRLVVETLAVAGLTGVVLATVTRGEPLERVLPILALFGMAALRLIPSATRMVAAINTLRFYAPATHAVTREVETSPLPAATRSEPAPAPRDFDAIDLRDLWFRHAHMDTWILQGVTLEIPRGSSLAIVGSSGAGKSTLADLMLGLLEPTRGAIGVDGRQLSSLGRSWQDLLGYVPQDVFILDDTIRANVAFALPRGEADDARVWKALDLAQLGEKVRSLPAALDAAAGERGIMLSGGERQRLAIARALYHDPAVLVFDEATSALDTQTEREVSETMERLMGRKTMIIVAHRLSTVKRCDRVLFLDGGRVAGCDRFDKLLQENAAFGEFVRGGL
jgi:ATP-binding cassette subfamily C protein